MLQDIIILKSQVGIVLVFLFGAATLLSLIARGRWPIELLQHFRPQMIAVGVLWTLLFGVLWFWFGFPWEWAAISLGLALINYAALPARACLKPDPALGKTPGLTVVWANVWEKEKALQRTLDWAKAQNADLILLCEFPKTDSASVLSGDYPHRFDTGAVPGLRHYEGRLVALSRMPIEDGVVRAGPGPNHRPWMTFNIGLGAERLNVAAAHPVPPFTAKLLAERTAHIAMLAPVEPFVVAGDFNTTPWTPGYAAIPGKRVGAYLFGPTWLSSLPLLGLPIDHIMVSAGLKASAYRVGPGLGSDHRAVLARVHLPGRAGGQ